MGWLTGATHRRRVRINMGTALTNFHPAILWGFAADGNELPNPCAVFTLGDGTTVIDEASYGNVDGSPNWEFGLNQYPRVANASGVFDLYGYWGFAAGATPSRPASRAFSSAIGYQAAWTGAAVKRWSGTRFCSIYDYVTSGVGTPGQAMYRDSYYNTSQATPTASKWNLISGQDSWVGQAATASYGRQAGQPLLISLGYWSPQTILWPSGRMVLPNQDNPYRYIPLVYLENSGILPTAEQPTALRENPLWWIGETLICDGIQQYGRYSYYAQLSFFYRKNQNPYTEGPDSDWPPYEVPILRYKIFDAVSGATQKMWRQVLVQVHADGTVTGYATNEATNLSTIYSATTSSVMGAGNGANRIHTHNRAGVTDPALYLYQYPQSSWDQYATGYEVRELLVAAIDLGSDAACREWVSAYHYMHAPTVHTNVIQYGPLESSTVTVHPVSPVYLALSVTAPTLRCSHGRVLPGALTSLFTLPTPTVIAKRAAVVALSPVSLTASVVAPEYVGQPVHVAVAPDVFELALSLLASDYMTTVAFVPTPLAITAELPEITLVPQRVITVEPDALELTISFVAQEAAGAVVAYTAAPDVLTLASSLPDCGVVQGAGLEPAALELAATVAAPDVLVVWNSTASPDATTLAITLPTPAVVAGRAALPLPDPVSLVAATLAPACSLAWTVTDPLPQPAAGFALPVPTVFAQRNPTVFPGVVEAVFSLPAPVLSPQRNPVATPVTVSAQLSLPIPEVTAANDYYPQGRQGIGVAQPQTGNEYPLLQPSADIQYLLADFQLEYEDPGDYGGESFTPPFRLAWLYGFGTEYTAGAPTVTHAADLCVVDANDRVVFDSSAASYTRANTGFATRAWGPRLRLYEWYSDTVACVAVRHTQWSKVNCPLPRAYPVYLEPDSAVLDARSVQRRPKRIRSLTVCDTALTEAARVTLRGGYNMGLTAEVAGETEGARTGHAVTLAAVAGSGDGVYPDCNPAPLYLRTINGIAPTAGGDFLLSTTNCYWLRRPLTVDSEDPLRVRPAVPTYDPSLTLDDIAPVAMLPNWPLTASQAHLQAGNDCKPCCDCEDYLSVANYLNDTRQRYQALGADAEAVRDVYHDNRDRWIAARECFNRRPLRLALQAQRCPILDVALQYCNHTAVCCQNLQLIVTFNAYRSDGITAVTGRVVPGFTRIRGASINAQSGAGLVERYTLGGDWPYYTAHWDGVQPAASVWVQFRLDFGLCDDPVAVTAALYGKINGKNVRVQKAGTRETEVAEVIVTRTLNCPMTKDFRDNSTKCHT